MEEECAVPLRHHVEHGSRVAHAHYSVATRQTVVGGYVLAILFDCLQLPRLPDKDYSTHRLLIGTHTSGNAPNYLEIAQVQLPNPVSGNPEDYDEEREEIGGHATTKKSPDAIKFQIIQRIDHKGEVNKARYQPQNPNIIATWCTDSRVMIWDKSKHSVMPTGTVNPEMELHGHTDEGYGMNWSPHQAGLLATGSQDKTVRLW
jgi:histone-binding protein RBBP4